MNRDSFYQLKLNNLKTQQQQKNISLSELSVTKSDYSDQTTTTQSTGTQNNDMVNQLANTRRVTSRLDGKLFAVYNVEKVANSRDCSRCCTIQPITSNNHNTSESGLILSFGDSSACLVNVDKLPIVTVQPKILCQMLGNYKVDLIKSNETTNIVLNHPNSNYKCSFHIPTRMTDFKRSLKDKFISKIKIVNLANNHVYKYNWIYNENLDCWLLKTPLHNNLTLAKFFTEKFKVNTRLEFYIKLDLEIQWILLTIIGFIVYN